MMPSRSFTSTIQSGRASRVEAKRNTRDGSPAGSPTQVGFCRPSRSDTAPPSNRSHTKEESRMRELKMLRVFAVIVVAGLLSACARKEPAKAASEDAAKPTIIDAEVNAAQKDWSRGLER